MKVIDIISRVNSICSDAKRTYFDMYAAINNSVHAVNAALMDTYRAIDLFPTPDELRADQSIEYKFIPETYSDYVVKSTAATLLIYDEDSGELYSKLNTEATVMLRMLVQHLRDWLPTQMVSSSFALGHIDTGVSIPVHPVNIPNDLKSYDYLPELCADNPYGRLVPKSPGQYLQDGSHEYDYVFVLRENLRRLYYDVPLKITLDTTVEGELPFDPANPTDPVKQYIDSQFASATSLISEHMNDNYNPHQVNADDVGLEAYKDYTAEKVAEVNAILEAHKGDLSNPHSIDAEDIRFEEYTMYTPHTLPVSKPTQAALLLKQTNCPGEHESGKTLVVSAAGVVQYENKDEVYDGKYLALDSSTRGVITKTTPNDRLIIEREGGYYEITTLDYNQSLDADDYMYYLGQYTSYDEFKAAYPIGAPGQYGVVDAAGQVAINYIWDNTEGDWVASGSGAYVPKTEYETWKLSIQQQVDSKVDKVGGKGLSTNDYSDEDKAKVTAAAEDITSIKKDVSTNKADINGLKEELNDIQDLSLTREFTSEEVGNGAVVGSICEVEKIDGKSEASKNLFDFNVGISISPQCTSNVIENGYRITANSSISSAIYIATNEFFLSAGTYYLKWQATNEAQFNKIRFFDNDISNALSDNIYSNGTFTIEESQNVKMLIYLRTANETTDVTNIIISKTDIPYTPYYLGFKHLEFSKLESTGVNLFDLDNSTTFTNAGLSITKIDNSSLKLKGTATNTYATFLYANELISGKTYYFKVNANHGNYVLWVRNLDDNSLSVNIKSGQSFTMPSGNMRIELVWENLTNGTTYDFDVEIMISLNDTEYVPYEVLDTINYGDIELKQYDYIYGVKKYSQSESVTFSSFANSVAAFGNSNVNDNNYVVRVQLTNMMSSGEVSNSMPSVFIGNTSNNTSLYYGEIAGIGFLNDWCYISMPKSLLSSNDLVGAKAYLNANGNELVVYQTSTITETPLNIFPYLNIKQNGNLTFDSNLSVNNTIIYPLNTKSEVARLSSLVGKLDNEIVELRSENETNKNAINVLGGRLDDMGFEEVEIEWIDKITTQSQSLNKLGKVYYGKLRLMIQASISANEVIGQIKDSRHFPTSDLALTVYVRQYAYNGNMQPVLMMNSSYMFITTSGEIYLNHGGTFGDYPAAEGQIWWEVD